MKLTQTRAEDANFIPFDPDCLAVRQQCCTITTFGAFYLGVSRGYSFKNLVIVSKSCDQAFMVLTCAGQTVITTIIFTNSSFHKQNCKLHDE